MLRLQMLERGINPRTVLADEAAVLRRIWTKPEPNSDDAIRQAALEPNSSYSVKLKYLRLLRVDGKMVEADQYAKHVAGQHPDAVEQAYAPECIAQHNEVLAWLKT